MAVSAWSILLPRRNAPVMPSGIEIKTPKRIAVIVSSRVAGSRSKMWLETRLPSIIERPKSPWVIPASQVMYWMYSGRSRPR